jgi:hypothetical protein
MGKIDNTQINAGEISNFQTGGIKQRIFIFLFIYFFFFGKIFLSMSSDGIFEEHKDDGRRRKQKINFVFLSFLFESIV